MPPIVTRLADVHTRQDLATALNVDIKAISLVSLTDATCLSEGCTLCAAKNNSGRCVLCYQRWFPKEFNDNGSLNLKRRGYGLIGPKFLRNYKGTSVKRVCACEKEYCVNIGFSHIGMMSFPNGAKAKEAVRLLGITDPIRIAKITTNPRSYSIAPWHYHRHHLIKKEGKYKIKKLESYCDGNGKVHQFAPPNGNIKTFIDEEILQPNGDIHWGETDELPSWVDTLQWQQYRQQQQQQEHQQQLRRRHVDQQQMLKRQKGSNSGNNTSVNETIILQQQQQHQQNELLNSRHQHQPAYSNPYDESTVFSLSRRSAHDESTATLPNHRPIAVSTTGQEQSRDPPKVIFCQVIDDYVEV